MRLRTLLLHTAILMCLLGVAVAGCGGDSDKDGKATPTSSSEPSGATTPGASGTSTGGGGAGGSNVTVTIADGEGIVGEPVNVVLQALGVGEPGIGAWTVDVAYDSGIISAASCDGITGPGTPRPATITPTPTGPGLAFCNPKFGQNNDTVRSTGAVVQGANGDVPLATITFTCESAGSSDLTISVDTLADATIGDPTDIKHTEQNGTITCS